MRSSEMFTILLTAAVLTISAKGEDVEFLFPERIHHTRLKRDLSTLIEGRHEDSLTIKIPTAKRGDILLDLEKADSPFPSHGITLITYDEKKNPKREQVTPGECHYTGTVRDQEDSHAYVTTCDGIVGTVEFNEGRFDIEPHNDEGAHKFYKVDNEIESLLKDSLKFETVATQEDQAEYIKTQSQAKAGAEAVRHYDLVNVEPQYIPYLTTNDTRYVEMFLSVDGEIWKNYNSTDKTIARMLNAIGQVDKSYSAINVRMIVVAIEIQTKGPLWTRETKGGPELGAFRTHIHSNLKKGALKDVRFDNAQFLSNNYWSDAGGMAWLNGLCGYNSMGVNGWSYSISGPTVIIGHEFGHNMNFPHDADMENCKCLTRRGCFMGGTKSSRPGFTDCNMRRLAAKPFTCINDYPVVNLHAKCGNGIIEAGEECDCGTPEMCKKSDPCCKPFGCKLKEESQCSALSKCCTKQCQFKQQGTLCRKSTTNCDAPEYCTGRHGTCPADRIRNDGTPCGESKTLVHGNDDRSWKTVDLTPPITAQYFKVIPKFWKKGGWSCLKMEMHGCDTMEDAASRPTSLRTPGMYYVNALCITPNITSCDGDIPDGTEVFYKSRIKYTCNHPHMMFVLRGDGVLIHKCTGKKVCPDASNNLIISSQCSDENSRFARRPDLGWSLQHNKTERCVLAENTWPYYDRRVHLSLKCTDTTYKRTKIEMPNLECKIPLGFESGALPDSAITFSPSTGQDYIRAGTYVHKAWCSETKDKGGWVQVNFGKQVQLHQLQTKGSYWNWVKAYYLMYSDDGVKFKYYMETAGPNTKEETSNCYKGTCAPIYDHQCQKLWSHKSQMSSKNCWVKYNMEPNSIYGTCDPLMFKPCDKCDAMCGQLQCSDPTATPHHVDFGANYTSETLDGKRCSLAKVVGVNDEPGIGMVADGTKCDEGKICVNQVCASPQKHGAKKCPIVNEKVCAGQGDCLDDGTCLCHNGYDPATSCSSMSVAVNGGWGSWSTWASCTKACGTGRRRRHRFCDTPFAQHGGTPCSGDSTQEEDCNTDACVVGRTCKDIKRKMESSGKTPHDGVYNIKPTKDLSLKAYCDMTRDGGGWTLVVSSHTNTWTTDNVRLRNVDSPDLYEDYSIFDHANKLKDTYLIGTDKYQYRLEANRLGAWGGIWEAASSYDASSTDSSQTAELLNRFSNWKSTDYNRVPYIEGVRIKFSREGRTEGSLTDDRPGYHPSEWFKGSDVMRYPEHAWYWIREGDYVDPKSCLDIMFRGFSQKDLFKSGVYKIKSTTGLVETYCDFDRHGGGWTLLMKTASKGGWTAQNILNRVYGSDEFSIISLYNSLKGDDFGELNYNYMIEADGDEKNGGIFSASRTDPNGKPIVVQKFGTWNEAVEDIAKHQLSTSIDMFGAFSHIGKPSSGAIIKSNNAVYMTSLQNPTTVKVWIRPGGSRKSCNDLRIHGHHNGKDDYKDGFYMINNSLPVFCDMTTTPKEGWTLLVTAANSGWSINQVYKRNINRPSLSLDYSILEMADKMKSLSHGTHFKYMMTSERRNHWGGIWQAPMEYSFVTTSKYLTDVKILQQFDNWSYNEIWYKCPCVRFPYIAPKSSKALLLSSSYPTYYENGVIISKTSTYKPGRWIYNRGSPGFIWYWLDESDCDGTDYKKVNGGYSISDWGQCSVKCGGEGVQKRTRKCDNPAPRCGGDPCDSSVSLVEERSCNIPCNKNDNDINKRIDAIDALDASFNHPRAKRRET